MDPDLELRQQRVSWVQYPQRGRSSLDLERIRPEPPLISRPPNDKSSLQF